MRKLAVAATLPLAIVAISVAAFTQSNHVSERRSARILDGGEGWVPFRAEMLELGRAGDVVVGHFYRDSDGSRRYETETADGRLKVISILNYTQDTYYGFNVREGWFEQPLGYSDGEKRPPKYRMRQGIELLNEKIEGLEVYRFSGSAGGWTLRAPALNFFEISSEEGDTGRRTVYKNIRVGDVPDDVFVAPADVIVKQYVTPKNRPPQKREKPPAVREN